MRLLLIRHGQTPHNVTGALDTAYPGAGLTALGREQAAAVPAALAEHDLAGIYASRLVRTQLTAAPLAADRGMTTRVRPGFEEISAGDLELRSDPDAVQEYAGCLTRWMCGDLDHALPGGSTGHAFHARYDRAVRDVVAEHGPDDTVAVFSHGAAIRVYAALAAGLPADVSTGLSAPNTAMGVLEGAPDQGWRLTRWTGAPLGGPQLLDVRADDVTGESAEEVAEA